MSPRVRLPLYFKSFVKETSVDIPSSTLSECLNKLCSLYPQVRDFVFASDSNFSQSVNIYINNRDIESLRNSNKDDILLQADDVIDIVPAIPGG